MLHIALAKGRVADQVMVFLQEAGIIFPEYSADSRKLIFTDADNTIKVTLVKSPDVPVYVELGAADVGIVGKDVLLEDTYDVYEIYNLNVGKCRMAVAGIKGKPLPQGRRLIVGTKYPRITKAYFNDLRRDVDIVKLNGSVELAPIVGLSDVIVDIVETGTTLKENGLEVISYFMDISTRMIANKAAFKLKQKEIQELKQMVKRR